MAARSRAKVWHRKEKDDWCVVMPLEGEWTNLSLILNPTAAIMWRFLSEGSDVSSSASKLREIFPEVLEQQAINDCLSVAIRMKTLGVYKMSKRDKGLLAMKKLEFAALHVFEETEAEPLGSLLLESFENAGTSGILHMFGNRTRRSFAPEILRGRHFAMVGFLMTSLSKEGRLQGVIEIDISTPRYTQYVNLFAVFAPDENTRKEIAGEMLRGLEEFAAIAKMRAHRLRFAVAMKRASLGAMEGGSCPSEEQPGLSTNWRLLAPILGMAGYRLGAVLEDEWGDSVDLHYYNKAIGVTDTDKCIALDEMDEETGGAK